MDKTEHWENVYQTKSSVDVSWYEPDPKQSLDLIVGTAGDSRGRVVDIGGGQSFLIDRLLDAGFAQVAVLDISQSAIEATKARLTAYITSLSQGLPVRMNPQRLVGPGALKQLSVKVDQADIMRGASLYSSRCAECHQQDGQGEKDNPPVWGERSYNDGAGLSSVENLAAWLKVAMPLDEADLNELQALDIAAYVNSKKRPHFDLLKHLPVKEKLGEYNASPAK